MKKIGLILFIVANLSSCSGKNKNEAITNDSQEHINEVSEDNEQKTADFENESALSFEEWLETAELPHKDLILSDVSEMSIEQVIKHYQNEYEIADDWLSVAYTDLQSEESYHYREEEVLTAASTTKVLLAMLFYDLVETGELELNSKIPYNSSMYEPGNGDITAEVEANNNHSSYSLDYVIEQMIVLSDNVTKNMLREFYRLNFGRLGEGMAEVIKGSKYTADLLEENETTALLLEETLLTLLEKDYYKPILTYMRLADDDLYFKYYIEEEMPVKYGLIHDLKHHIGIYEIDDQPIYSLVILSENLDDEQANEFLGSVNLQLIARAQYYDYLKNSF